MSKEFIIRRGIGISNSRWATFQYLNGNYAINVCYRAFSKFFGIKLEPGEKKQIRVTIEEVKK